MAKFEGSAKISKKEGDTSINVSLGKKGFFERLRERRESQLKQKQQFCGNCGKFMKESFAICAEDQRKLMYDWQRTFLCKDCAKKCNKCGKYYCPTHLKKHKCI
ncbi:MAG: hypothetical protein Q7J54_07525 [Candidatus Woesearchaeota archaeon]|nr:hypothetical protein [Candidatus Woesearchaeota archaeon]